MGAVGAPPVRAWRSRVERYLFAPAPWHRRVSPTVVTAAAVGLLVLVEAALAAARLPPTNRARVTEARLTDAAYAALHPVGAPPTAIGLDGLAARLQLTAYARVTGAFERGSTVVTGARELGLVAGVVLLAAVAALARSLGVRPSAAAATLGAAAMLGAVALAQPALAALVVLGPGLLGAAWLTLAAALLARSRTGVRALGAPAVAAGVVSAPVLAVAVLVGGAALLVGQRLRRGPVLLGTAMPATILPLALVPAPGGAAALPALVVVAVLIGLVLVDAVLDRLVPPDRPIPVLRWTGVAVVAVGVLVGGLLRVPVVASVLVEPAPSGARGLAAWVLATTEPPTTLDVPPGVWADLLRAGVPPGRLDEGGALTVAAGPAPPGPMLARFGAGGQALTVQPTDRSLLGTGPTPAERTAATRLAGDRNLTAPAPVRALLGSGTVDARVCTLLLALAGRGPVVVLDLPVVAGEDPAVPLHRAVLAAVDVTTRAWLAAQPRTSAPIVTAPVPDGGPTTLTWPLPAPTG